MSPTRKWSEIKAAKSVKRYGVIATRDGRFWFLRVIGRPELFTQTVRLDQAEVMVRDLIATWDEVDPYTFEIDLRILMDKEIEAATEGLRRVRLIDALGTAVARSLAVHLVRETDLSLRDAGRVLELSHQRVAQLLEEHDALGGDRRDSLAANLARLEALTPRGSLMAIRAGDDQATGERVRAMLPGMAGKPRFVQRDVTGAFVQRSAKSAASAVQRKRT